MLGEGIVFGIAAFVLIVENRRAAASEVVHFPEKHSAFCELQPCESPCPAHKTASPAFSPNSGKPRQARKAMNIKTQFEAQQRRIEQLEARLFDFDTPSQPSS